MSCLFLANFAIRLQDKMDKEGEAPAIDFDIVSRGVTIQHGHDMISLPEITSALSDVEFKCQT